MTTIPLTTPTAKYPGADCTNCPLRDQPFVPPWNVEAGEILFVGEAPGTQEVLEGIPFVGQSGQLLDRVIERIGGDPLRAAKTNAVLCRPTRNPDGSVTPSEAAQTACRGALEYTLSLYPGRTVVSLGAVPTAALDDFSDDDHQEGIMARRGVWCKGAVEQPYHDVDYQREIKVFHYLPTLHPAFVLRSPNYVQKLIDDVQKAYQGAEKKPALMEVGYIEVTDFEQLKEMILVLRNAPDVTFDVETSYLRWYEAPAKKAANVLCLVFACNEEFAYIVPDTTLQQPRVLEFLQMFFDSKEVAAHNGKFDVVMCAARLGLRVRLCDDTFLMHYVLNEGKRGHGLKELAGEYFQLPDYEAEILGSIFKEHKMSKANRNYEVLPREQLYHYAAIDGCVTLALLRVLRQQLIEENQHEWPYKKILIRASNALSQVELNGIPVDRAYLEKVLALVEADVHQLGLQLRALAGKADLNPNSPIQLNKVLYGDMKLQLKKQPIKATSTNTGEECLLILLETYPDNVFLTTLMEYRRVEKIRNTYVAKLLELADSNDVVHINFNLHGTETGRLSADDSMHGIPNPEDEDTPPLKQYGAMIRGSFIAPPGYKLIVADYSQAELRCFAEETKEPFLLDAYNTGKDVHDETTKIMAPAMGKVYAEMQPAEKKNLRRLAKNVNFGGLVYLGGPQAIAALTGLDPKLVKAVMDHYYDHLSIARQWQKDQFRFAKRNGYVQNRFGRKRRFILQTSNNIDEIRKASVNAVIQGDASDLTLLSVCEMIESGIYVCHTVHDSIIALAPEDQAQHVAERMKAIMERIGNTYFSLVPWEADIDISDYWYEKRPNLEIAA